MKTWMWALLVVGCIHRPLDPPTSPKAPPLDDWADQVGAVLPQAEACVLRHPEQPAVVVGIRVLSTGEIGIMTRGPGMRVIACVHDGNRVIHQAAVPLDSSEIAALSFVTLGASEAAPRGACRRSEPVHWGSEFVGWLTKLTCTPRKMSQSPGSPATSDQFRRERDEYLDGP